MKCLVLFAVIAINVIGIYSSEKPAIKVVTIQEAPYITGVKVVNSTNLEDYSGYIPDFLTKISQKINRKFLIHLVADKKYGTKMENGQWNGMIGEVASGKADLAAAPITSSSERTAAVDFSETFMTFDTLVVMKKGAESSKIRSAAELHNNASIKVGVVKDGFTENFFKSTTQQEVYKNMYARMDKESLPLTSAEGVKKVRASNGDYAFVIEAATADYWINHKPCDLVAFRLGSALQFHSYSFAMKKGSDFRGELNQAIEDLKSKGEHDTLRAKWWPTECSAAARFSTLSTSLMALLAAAIAAIRIYVL